MKQFLVIMLVCLLNLLGYAGPNKSRLIWNLRAKRLSV
jgi:hypothetical protein